MTHCTLYTGAWSIQLVNSLNVQAHVDKMGGIQRCPRTSRPSIALVVLQTCRPNARCRASNELGAHVLSKARLNDLSAHVLSKARLPGCGKAMPAES